MLSKTLLWAIKTTCNLGCDYCYFEQEERANDEQKNLTEFERILAKIKPDVTYISGGEPTLQSDLVSIINLIHKNGSKVVLTTNGTRFDEKYAKKVVETGVEGILVSLDGPDAKTHNSCRSKFEETYQGLLNLNKHKTDTKLGICYVVHSKNYDKLIETVWFAVCLGADYFTYQPVDVPDGSALGLTDKMYSRFISDVDEIHKHFKDKIKLPSTEYVAALKNVRELGYFGTRCYAGEKLFFLDENFMLKGCPLQYAKPNKQGQYCNNEGINCVTMIELVNSGFIR